ncbi:MAG: hypothetical protein ACREEL_01780 [Stellaceae bacterium]
MIRLAFDVLIAAALLGAGLAVHYLRGPTARRPHPALPLVHGALGAAGLGLLIVVLRAGLPRLGNGTSGFGVIAAGLFGLALALGLAIAHAAWRGRRPGSLVVGTHASLAITGLVVLLVLVALG